MLDLVHSNHISVGKYIGSTTEITQACDTWAVCKGPKLKHQHDYDRSITRGVQEPRCCYDP